MYNSIKIDKPWGFELIWAHTDKYVGKILHVNAGESLSIQYHREKDETMYVISGEGKINLFTLDEESVPLLAKSIAAYTGVSVHIKPLQIHNVYAETEMEILEVSTNHLEDLVRIQDRYDRK